MNLDIFIQVLYITFNKIFLCAVWSYYPNIRRTNSSFYYQCINNLSNDINFFLIAEWTQIIFNFFSFNMDE